MSEYEPGVRLVCGKWFNNIVAVAEAARKVREAQFGGEPCESPQSRDNCPYCAMDDLVAALDKLDEEEN